MTLSSSSSLLLLCVFILITCNNKLNFKFIFDFFNKNNSILLHNDHNDDDIRMIGKVIT